MNKKYVITGAIFICLGIILGAFGAHALKKSLGFDEINSFEVGVRYQIYHGFALVVMGLAANIIELNNKYFNGFLFGTILFSCSIYALVLDAILKLDFSFIGPITPVGGAILIATWFYFIFKTIRST
ncbi:DUF423 domain-containing protein [Crocinitomicaceae bacterium]|jgi:uncharacterized membrane protein YgdD (TMEM256/DUF423 family)|nr:DUF423 domain-containing protein [Crocinitomicaceae bacterium]